MVSFDRAVTYQFSLFFEDAGWSAEQVEGVGALVARLRDGGDGLGLKFGPPELENALANIQGALTPVTLHTWKGAVWRLQLSAARLDLFFEARTYAEFVRFVDVEEASRRVAANLAQVAAHLESLPVRIGLVATAVGGDGARAGSALVARRFLSPTLDEQAQRGEVSDAMVRVNRPATWRLGELSLPVNVLETATVTTAFRGEIEDVSLSWSVDVNSKHRALDEVSATKVEDFFGRAAAHIATVLADVGVR